MQLLVLFAFVGVSLADSDAGLLYGGYGGYAGYGGYGHGYASYGHGYGHGFPLRTGVLPATVGGGLVTHYNGAVVPADEPAVVAARADHFAAKAHAYGGYGHGIYKREADAGLLYGGAYAGHGYAGLGYAGYGGYLGYAGHHGGHYGGYTGPLSATLPATVGGGLVSHYNGAVVPADEPAVVAARADHLAAKAHAYGAYGHGIYKREAEADAGLLYGGAYAGHGYAGLGYAGYGGYLGYAGHHGGHYGGYSGPLSAALPATVGGGLVTHPNGAVVPADEPAVVAARADHLLAQGAAYGNAYSYGHGAYLW